MSREHERLRLRDAGIRLDSMPAAGRELRLSSGPEEREAVAAALGITAVERLDVTLHALKFRGGMRVTGRLEATIVQPSIVSLEPVRQEVGEPIDRVLLPGRPRPAAGTGGAEVFIDLEGEDLPDHFEGPEADLTELILETLALGLDPYPRAEGESLEDLDLDLRPEKEESPFARLKSLRSSGDGE